MLSKPARYALALRFLETDNDIRGAELASSRRLVMAPEMAGDARAVATHGRRATSDALVAWPERGAATRPLAGVQLVTVRAG